MNSNGNTTKVNFFNNPWIKENKYYIALVLALVNIFSSLIDSGNLTIRVTIILFLSIILNILCFYFIDDKKHKKSYLLILRTLKFAIYVLIPMFIIYILHLYKALHIKFLFEIFLFSVYFYSIFINLVIFKFLIADVITRTAATFSVVIGSFVGYLWLGIISSYLVIIMYVIYPASYYIPKGVVFNAATSLYFSYDCVTAFGFSDITPRSDFMRLMVIMMEVVGQFYTIVIVGIILNNFFNFNNSSTSSSPTPSVSSGTSTTPTDNTNKN